MTRNVNDLKCKGDWDLDLQELNKEKLICMKQKSKQEVGLNRIQTDK